MTLAWLLPWAWGALAALLVPLLLHLDRRRAMRPLRFAALRWIGARQRPQRTWRLREPWLLLLRLLLLAAIVAWLAQPLLRGEWGTPRHWIAVAPGATFTPDGAPGDVRAVWLAPGFPPHDTPAPTAPQPIASLLRDLDATLAPRDMLTVLVPRELDGLDAARLVLSRDIDWRVVAGNSPGQSDAAPVVALRYASADDPAVSAARRVFAAWSASGRYGVEIDDAPMSTPLPAAARAIVWVGDTPAADALARVQRGATLLQIGADEDAATAWPPLASTEGRGTRLYLARFDPPNDAALREADLPARLHALLLGEAPPPTRADADAVRPGKGNIARRPRETALRPWLAWIIGLLFLLERVLATRPHRGQVA